MFAHFIAALLMCGLADQTHLPTSSAELLPQSQQEIPTDSAPSSVKSSRLPTGLQAVSYTPSAASTAIEPATAAGDHQHHHPLPAIDRYMAGLIAGYCVLIVTASVIGGWLPSWIELTHTRMQTMISFVGGLMLGIGVFHLLPHATHSLPSVDAAAGWMMAGMLTMFLLIRMFHFHHHGPLEISPGDTGEDCDAHAGASGKTGTVGQMQPAIFSACNHDHDHDHADGHADGHGNGERKSEMVDSAAGTQESARAAAKGGNSTVSAAPAAGVVGMAAIVTAGPPCHHAHQLSWLGIAIGLSVHTLIDGIALAASVQAESAHPTFLSLFGLGTFLAVMLHKPLDAVSITSLMAVSGWTRRSRNLVNAGFAMMCPAGAVIFLLGVHRLQGLQQQLVGSALAFSAGVFICISLSDLLPEMEFHAHNRTRLTAVLIAGIFLAWGITFLEPGHLH